MKKLFYILPSMALLFSACQQAELPKPPETMDPTDIVYATIEDATDTRTFLDGEKVVWTSGDEIVVFKGKTLPLKFIVNASSVGSTEGFFNKDADYELIGPSSSISHNVAFYPFAEITCKAEGQTYTLANLTLPSVQTYAPASFGQEVFPMVAVTADTDDVAFAFKNVCGVLALQLKGSGAVKSISVKGNSDEILCGEAVITAAYGKNPEIALLSSGSKTVTLECGESGVELQSDTPTSFLIALPPVSFDNGFTVTVADVSGTTKEYSTTKKNIILRSGILRMPEKEFVGERVPQEGDYIDEYGINHGPGVKIGETVWAPVNCGYHATDFKYGKLYQWGRKYGQGYDSEDAFVPEIIEGPVSLIEGLSKDNENKFYKNSYSPHDWLYPQTDKLWNFGTEENPIKTEYDPCPAGWRVPTRAELKELSENSYNVSVSSGGGFWFSGSAPYSSSVPKVFFPAAGCHYFFGGTCCRSSTGYYWSSRMQNGGSGYLYFNWYNGVAMYNDAPACGYSVRCVQDDLVLIPVERVLLSKASLSLFAGSSETLSLTITPTNANHQSTHWWSDNPKVAKVDLNGNVTAVTSGTATVTAMAGMQMATCEITVTGTVKHKDYIDEYGINHGQGIEIDGVVWAPVNCGYHAADFKYGKLYQWGRKYGQGCDSADASVPEIVEGSVSLIEGQSKVNENKFYYNSASADTFGDWCSPSNKKLWNSGMEDNPIKTEYDPCPAGWRVPTFAELQKLSDNYSSWRSVNNQSGRWFSGSESYSSSVPKVFFPAAGYRLNDGTAKSRGSRGCYWSSNQSFMDATCLNFNSSDVDLRTVNGRAYGYSVRCVQDDSEIIPVECLILNKTSLTLSVGASEILSSTITPSNANHQSAHWWADNPSVATVDANGNVTAVSEGTTTITAMAGMQVATCKVTVIEPNRKDYIDEYGVNHGKGTAIGMAIWAPVNCGYHATDFKYGKLYQWGRKYGQGYDSDSTVPTLAEGGVSEIGGNHKNNANVFYIASSDWVDPRNDKLWNSGTEANPVKTEYDPCPEGWRVPTYAELKELCQNYSSWTSANGQSGRWFCGASSYTAVVPQVFFPAAGYRNYDGGIAYNRGYSGTYWSSGPTDYYGCAYDLSFGRSSVGMDYGRRADGASLRCVQATDEVAEL